MNTMFETVRESALEESKPFRVVVDGEDVLLAKINGEIFAVSDICTHSEVSLSEGDIEGCAIECWLHGSSFDLRTGKPSGPPATTPLKTFAIKLEEDQPDPMIFVSLSESARS
jgi:3-phenylpropionate/trans-cinnamate dioxygenase ferredoxin component